MKIPFLGRKKKAEETKGRGSVPTRRVQELMSRGFSELDTIDVLRREGYSPDEIDSALTQSVKEGVVGRSENQGSNIPQRAISPQENEDFDDAYQRFKQKDTQQSAAGMSQQEDVGQTFPPRKSQQVQKQPQTNTTVESDEGDLQLPTIEELEPMGSEGPSMPETSLPNDYYQGYPAEEYIDYVVQERTTDIIDKINEMSLHNKELENRVKEMNDRVKDLGKMRVGEQQQIMNTIEGLTDSVNDVNMRIAALEKAFKETLPALIESVRALSDLVQRMKREA